MLRRLFPALLVLTLTACAPQPLTVTPQPVTLRLAVSDACEKPVRALVQAYHRQKPWVAIETVVFNDAVVRERLQGGAADGAALIWAEESAGFWTHPFADDALAIIVHPAVPVENLTLPELRDVLRGRIGEWPDGTPIQVVSREDGAGSQSIIQANVLSEWDLTLTARLAPDDARIRETVARTPGAIGYIPISCLAGDVRALTLEGIAPAPVPDYPLHYSCLWAATAEPTGALRDWFGWTLGPQGQSIAERSLHPPPDSPARQLAHSPIR